MGSIEELGNWKEFKCPMVWNEGHIWEAQDIEIKSARIFQYKYVIVENGKDPLWEKGFDRIADLKILEKLA